MKPHRKLKALRASKGYHQIHVAEYLGISKGHYCNKENGKAEFSISEIEKLRELFADSNGIKEKYENIFFD